MQCKQRIIIWSKTKLKTLKG